MSHNRIVTRNRGNRVVVVVNNRASSSSVSKRKKTKLSSSSSNSSSQLLPSRKIRTKTRKPKYLKLVQLDKPMKKAHELNLFPIRQDDDGDGDDDDDGENNDVDVASFLFDDTSTSLNNLLSPATTTESELDPCFDDHRRRDDGGDLVRTAMKKGRRESDGGCEERWVCYSEVVEKKESEEVGSCGGGGGAGVDDDVSYSGAGDGKKKKKVLSLKLDYEEILNAWSDKGSLFVQGGHCNSQVVPDLRDNVHIMDGWGSVGNLWQVPEMSGVKVEGMETKEKWNTEQRQASVLRYKEKRNSRLFSKRIRYEVRKLNAEKRPRLKGRFVKRD